MRTRLASLPDFARMQAFGVALAESSALVQSTSSDLGHRSADGEASQDVPSESRLARSRARRIAHGEREARVLARAAVAVSRARADERRYRAIFEALAAPALLSDRAGEVFRMNRAAKRLLGLEGVTIVRRPIERLFERAATEYLGEALGRIHREPLSLYLRLAIGSKEWVEVQARPASASEIFWTLSGDGATREAGLARRLSDKDEVIERQRQMIEALERDSRAKDKFIAVLGHDLRAPLNAVLGWTQLMRRELLDTVGRERALATIERNARSQAALIEELLDVTRINEGRLSLEISACDVALLVRRTLEAALPDASSKGIRLITQLQSGVTVAGDRRRLEQIVNNLVSNALRFTPAGGSIQVSVTRDSAHARVEVRDTGKGIATEQLPHVFSWLHQGADHPPTRDGLGLGLFIVRRLVELHGGTVSASSEGLGRGATFTALLPHCDPGIVSAPSSATLPELGELDGIDVLVVEDETDAVELISRVLATRGACVTSARDASSALAFALPNRPDVIVTDLGLPDMDGYELVRRVRAEHGGRVGIVALTGFAARDFECGPTSGFDDRLTKPVDIPRLIKAVEQAARVARARAAS